MGISNNLPLKGKKQPFLIDSFIIRLTQNHSMDVNKKIRIIPKIVSRKNVEISMRPLHYKRKKGPYRRMSEKSHLEYDNYDFFNTNLKCQNRYF